MLSEFFQSILQLLFPPGPYCYFCGSSLKSWEVYWCSRCKKEISNHKGLQCRKCARFITGGEMCSFCQKDNYPFTVARSAGLYDGKLKEALQEFKFRGKRSLAKPLGRLLALEAIKDERFLEADLIIPVPMHRVKLAQRGYNQSELLAKEVAVKLGIPFEKDVLVKIRHTADMVGLGREERSKNLQGAFFVQDHNIVLQKSILLIDDIFTTGFTALSCSETLLKAGAKKVLVLTAASNFDIYS